MGSKKIIIILVILILLSLVGGGYYFFAAEQESKPKIVEPPQVQEEVIPTANPEDLGFKLTARSDKKAVKFEVLNIKDILSVDYELSYLAQGNIPRGAIGHVEVKPDDVKISTSYIDLGSCSSGKCKYDEGVTSVKMILKINKKDGKVYSSEKSLEL